MGSALFMSNFFGKISILGGGLLGGSVALSLNGLISSSLWFRKSAAAAMAGQLGIPGATDDLREAVSSADLLILAVPVGAMPELLKAAIEAGLPAGCLVTDVGSVKQAPHRALAAILEKSGNLFIGSHPMAGSEQNGIGAARSDLFKNAACILTNDFGAPEEMLEKLENFWQSLGCHTTRAMAADHDETVARISHLPHITAAATAKSALKDPKLGKFGGGGLRDTTRVASGNPAMWAEILTENREAIIPVLEETIMELSEILATLKKSDQEHTQQWLRAAKLLRDTLPNI